LNNNNFFFIIEALIILHASPNYRFINIDQDGQIASFAPRTSDGYHHVLLIVKEKLQKIYLIYIPILPVKVGSIEVTIEGITGVKRDIVTQKIEVMVRFIILNKYEKFFFFLLA
jgi:hypothetical protein